MDQVHIPNNIDQLKEALKLTTPASSILAGGTDLVISLHEGKKQPDLIIDLSGVRELSYIKEEGHFVFIGAMTTFSEIKESTVIKNYYPCLESAAANVGSNQIRNRATIGGNIGNASPAGDSLPVLAMLNAAVVVMDAGGIFQEYPVGELLTGARTTRLSHREVITAIKIPVPHCSFRSAYVKLGNREAVTIAMINAAMGVRLEEKTMIILDAALVVGAISQKVLQAREIEKILINRHPDESLLKEFSQALSRLIEETAPVEFEMEYKKDAVWGVARDLFEKLFPETFSL